MEHTIEMIEMSIEEAKKKLEFGRDLEKLLDNPLFQKVITEGYMQTELVRLGSLFANQATRLTDSTGTGEEKVAYVGSQICAVEHFRNFIRYKRHEAMLAEKALYDLNADHDELLKQAE